MSPNKNYSELRGPSYQYQPIEKKDLDLDPFQTFHKWFNQALKVEDKDVNAFSLASLNSNGDLYNRIVLLKEVTEEGFIFYTNYLGRKSMHFKNHPKAAMNFFWKESSRQIQITGDIKKIEAEKSDLYFKSRPRESQLGALASHQSQPLSSSLELKERYQALEKKYEDQEIPRPEHWGGFIIRPRRFEFWQGAPSRLHDRFEYLLDHGKWQLTQLNP